MKRAAIALFTAMTLLMQGMVWANTAPRMGEASRFASTARGDAERPHMDVRAGVSENLHSLAMDGIEDGNETMPCHGEQAPSIQKQSPCCGESCDCPELCAGSTAAVSPSFSFATSGLTAFSPVAVLPLRLSVNHHEQLRPPAAL